MASYAGFGRPRTSRSPKECQGVIGSCQLYQIVRGMPDLRFVLRARKRYSACFSAQALDGVAPLAHHDRSVTVRRTERNSAAHFVVERRGRLRICRTVRMHRDGVDDVEEP